MSSSLSGGRLPLLLGCCIVLAIGDENFRDPEKSQESVPGYLQRLADRHFEELGRISKRLGKLKENLDHIERHLIHLPFRLREENNIVQQKQEYSSSRLDLLIESLLNNNKQKKRIIPIAKNSPPLLVKLHVRLYQILEINERQEYAKLYLWMAIHWENLNLGWNPELHDDIKEFSMTADEHDVWMPDIYLYNGIELRNEKLNQQTILSLKSIPSKEPKKFSSIVTHSYPRMATFSCGYDTFLFPFDYQRCVIYFGSWAYQRDKIQIIPQVDNLTDFIPNDEWELLAFTPQVKEIKFSCCSEPYSMLTIDLLLRRRPLFYIVNLLIPSVIITQISLFGFFTPSSSEGERGEKVSLGMGTLLAMSILLLLVSEMTPVTSSYVPLFGAFFLSIMILISLGVGMTTLIMQVHQRGKRGKKVPEWAQRIFFCRIAPALGFKIPTVIQCARQRKESVRRLHNVQSSGEKPECSETAPFIEQIPALCELSEQVARLAKGRKKEICEVEYQFLAKILDAMCLLIFSILLYCLTFGIVASGLLQEAPLKPAVPLYTDAKVYHEYEEEKLRETYYKMYPTSPLPEVNHRPKWYYITPPSRTGSNPPPTPEPRVAFSSEPHSSDAPPLQ